MVREAWLDKTRTKKILRAFYVPVTPKHAFEKLGTSRFKLKPLLQKSLITCLNPDATKGRLFQLTETGRKIVGMDQCSVKEKDWQLIGWLFASPRQRLTLLKYLDSVKRTSEELRRRAIKSNPCLSRVSTKAVLRELISKGMVNSMLSKGKRYYWITDEGSKILADSDKIYK